MDHVDILGVKIDKSSYREVLDRIEKQIKSKKQAWIATPNPEIVLKAGESEKYRQVLNSANLRISDGIGLSVATKYLDKIKDRNYKLETLGKLWLWKITVLEMLWDKKLVEKILPQISGDELIFKLLPLARKNNWKIFLLGGKQGNAKLAIEKINNKYGVEVK